MDITKVMVVGGGLMGQGIAQVCIEAGLNVVLCEISEELARQARSKIEKRFDRKIEKGKITTTDKDTMLQKLQLTTDISDGRSADLVIEAIPEDLELKKDLFKKLDATCKGDTILATNTSALPITEIAAVTKRPHKVIGTHFFYPAPVMKLLEIVPGLATDQSTVNAMYSFAEVIGKQAVSANDYPGFIVNRLLIPMVNEAIFLVMEGVAPEDVDKAMKLGCNHPMGPIELADFVGLDVLLATMRGLYNGFNDPKYRPCPLLVKMVQSGNLGQKTGRGFYSYED